MTPPTLRPARSTLRVTIGAGIVLVLLGLAVAVLVAALAPHGSSGSVVRSTAAPANTAPPADTMLVIHVLGEVRRPGLYQLHAGDRVIDAVALAGGFTGRADQNQLNLARLVSDGEQLVIERRGATATVPGKTGAASTTGARVSINTGTAAELETLPRVGPALAQRIIDWRTANGRFSSIDDLLNVSGIGEKTLAGFRAQVTL
ncbi:MAG: competence protein ComEA [Glaciihabitans sp.]|nr:competence protein ComEA [Glaciihabitans sp.]